MTKTLIDTAIMKTIGQKQPSRSVLKKWCFENMQQIYRRTPMTKCDFNKVASKFIKIALRHGCSPVNLLHIFKAPFPKNTSGRLLLYWVRARNHLKYGVAPGNAEVSLKMSDLKPLHSCWIVEMCDYLKQQKRSIQNRFDKLV